MHGIQVNDKGKVGFRSWSSDIELPCVFDEIERRASELFQVRVGHVVLHVDKDLNYYEGEGPGTKSLLQKLDCEACKCYNDKLTTSLCCQFFK